MANPIEASILAAEKRRSAAMLANDPAALDAVLDPQLQFAHATGAVDDKAAFLAKMASGRIKYKGIVWSEENITQLGPDAAMLTGRMNTDVEVEGTAKALKNRVITIWKRSGDEWLLLAFQSTPLKD